MHVDWRSSREDYAHGPPPSGVHGWLTKLRGYFSFNRRLIRHGNDEIQDARALRDFQRHERDRRRRRRSHSRSRHSSREGGFFSNIFGRRRYGVEVADGGRHRHRRNLHQRRCRPWYDGDHHRFWGFLTRRRSLMDLGRAKREHAKRERDRQRRHRLRRLRDEGLAIRLGADYLTKDPAHRSRRRHHHSSRGQEIVVSN